MIKYINLDAIVQNGEYINLDKKFILSPIVMPILDNINYTIVDTHGGGNNVVLFGSNLDNVSSIVITDAASNVFIVSPILVTSTSVTFVFNSVASVGVASVFVDADGEISNSINFDFWSPKELTNLRYYFHSRNYVYSNPSVWSSDGGSDAIVTYSSSGGVRPTLTSLGSNVGLSFNGGGQILNRSAGSTAPNLQKSIWCVMSTTSSNTTVSQPNFSVPLPITGWSGGWCAFGMSGGQVDLTSFNVSGSTPSGNILKGAGLNDGFAHLVGFRNTPGQDAEIFVDGFSYGTTGYQIGYYDEDRIGTSYPLTDFFEGVVGCIIHQSTITTDDEIIKLNAWTSQQFG